MRTIYLKVNRNGFVRKISIDMAYLATNKKIRLPKYYFEEGIYLSYKKNINDSIVEEYFLTKDQIKKEDSDFYYFDFPFKTEQVSGFAV